MSRGYGYCFFFFQAEDGIRDLTVTGVQTCALPILAHLSGDGRRRAGDPEIVEVWTVLPADDQEILKTRGGHEDRARALPLEDRVRGHGRAVSHADRAEVSHPLDDGPRRIPRRGNLRRHDRAAAEPDEVRERPAHVHTDIHCRPDCWRPQETSREGRVPSEVRFVRGARPDDQCPLFPRVPARYCAYPSMSSRPCPL